VLLLAASFVWAYWPTFVELVKAWNREPDYSHGFIVPLLAVFFLWARRDRFPGFTSTIAWPGLVLIALSVSIRAAGALAYIGAIDAWSMLLWLGGAVWLVGGYRVALWSLPSLAFLWFMIPLPFRAETMLSYPLQRIATTVSTWSLQCLGQGAVAEGNVIMLGNHQLEVEQACSGLRIFVGIVALAFAYVIVVRRPWWEKALLLASTLPIALIANGVRVVVTGLLFQFVSGEAAQKFTHDFSGWVMIPFAAALFGFVLWYLGKLFPEVEQIGIVSLVHGVSPENPAASGKVGKPLAAGR
jgi:exosortase